MHGIIKVLVVDDHHLLRDAIGKELSTHKDIDVVGDVADAEGAFELALRYQPDVMLMDIDMPGVSCFDVVRRLSTLSEHIRVLFLSAYASDHYIEQAISVEAAGYLLKDEPLDKVIDSIYIVACGGTIYSDYILSRLVIDTKGISVKKSIQSRLAMLSGREVEVLKLLAHGLTKRQLARELHLSVSTISRHTQNIMAKLDIHDRVKLAHFAIKEGLILMQVI